jgi:hypothetical protein
MSTTIKSTMYAHRTAEVSGDSESVGLVLRSGDAPASTVNVKTADLIAALRAEGVLAEDDGLRDRLTDVLADWDANLIQNKTARDRIREALNPTPPYVFPTGLGAVVEGERQDVGTVLFIRTGHDKYPWFRAGHGAYSEGDVATKYANLRTLSEGVEL